MGPTARTVELSFKAGSTRMGRDAGDASTILSLETWPSNPDFRRGFDSLIISAGLDHILLHPRA